MPSKELDPLAYIENAFVDSHADGTLAGPVPDSLDLQLSIGEYLNGDQALDSTGAKRTTLADPTRVKFKRRQLSAPRPRRSKAPASRSAVDSDLHQVWGALPRNIEFLSSFFDDSVTANYYRGEFKESRQDLIRRLLDPELSLEEVSRLLGVCPATVRRYTNRQWLQHHRTPGGQRRFRLSGVVKFVEEHGRHPEG